MLCKGQKSTTFKKLLKLLHSVPFFCVSCCWVQKHLFSCFWMCTFKHWKSNPWPWHCYRHSQFLLKKSEFVLCWETEGKMQRPIKWEEANERCLWREWMWWRERTEGEKNGFVSAVCGVKIILQSALPMASSAALLSIPSLFNISTPLLYSHLLCLLTLSKTQEQPASFLVHCSFFWV